MTTEKPSPLLRSSSVYTNEAGKSLLQWPLQWSGLPLNLYRSAGRDECGPSHVDSPTLLLCISGCQGRRWHRQNGKTVELSGGVPGMIDLYDRDYQREWTRWDLSPGITVGMSLRSEVISRLLPEMPDFDISTSHGLLDPKLYWLVQELVDEMQNGAPGGILYAESLSCALIARLAKCYGTRKANDQPVGALSPNSRRRMIDFIEANLGENLSIAVLAREVSLSPDHFSRCFTVSFGLSPHRYVQQRRIEAARKLLTSSSRPLAEIALDLGFYSHTHFTRIFRQHTGMSPSRARSN